VRSVSILRSFTTAVQGLVAMFALIKGLLQYALLSCLFIRFS